jgi:hypothetical protein
MLSNSCSKCHSVDEIMWKKCAGVGQATDMAHALCVLDKKIYRHTLRIYRVAEKSPYTDQYATIN